MLFFLSTLMAADESVLVNGIQVSLKDDLASELTRQLRGAKDARIVHFTGDVPGQEDSLHQIRARLLRFFHEELDYSVLVLPVGIYEGIWVNEQLNGDVPLENAAAPLYRPWRESEAFLELLEDIRATRQGSEGLEIIGGLCRFHATGKELYMQHLLRFFETPASAALPEELRQAVAETWGGRDRLAQLDPPRRKDAAQLAQDLIDHLETHRSELEKAHGVRRIDREHQVLINMRTFVQLEQIRAGDIKDDGSFATHEKEQNLEWLLHQRGPQDRIIYWEGRGADSSPLPTDETVFVVKFTAD